MNHYYALYQIAEEHVAEMRCEADNSRKLKNVAKNPSAALQMLPASLALLVVSLAWLFR